MKTILEIYNRFFTPSMRYFLSIVLVGTLYFYVDLFLKHNNTSFSYISSFIFSVFLSALTLSFIGSLYIDNLKNKISGKSISNHDQQASLERERHLIYIRYEILESEMKEQLRELEMDSETDFPDRLKELHKKKIEIEQNKITELEELVSSYR